MNSTKYHRPSCSLVYYYLFKNLHNSDGGDEDETSSSDDDDDISIYAKMGPFKMIQEK